eukprot:TRINITY_DN27052_c3_g1_i1.p1 TRINITY_DN27052_c3_g1~~TRINITY_DN27052_c3_g1_i1.p1  ORF type:complete len:495 (-),score=30.05 TRINITY_DN27052_c3_g1_i1:127-1611(-)
MYTAFGWSLIVLSAYWNSLAERSDVDDEPTGGRVLATLKRLPHVTLSSGLNLSFVSAIPVFGDNASYIALLHRYSQGTWNASLQQSLYCASPDGKHNALMRVYGGESRVAYKSHMAWHCDWPELHRQDRCHPFVLHEGAYERPLAHFEACHEPTIYKEKYNLAACVAPMFDGGAPEANGLMLSPQWLEYHVMHGTDQFLVYCTPASDPRMMSVVEPYIKRRLISVINMTDFHECKGSRCIKYMKNDCLYRTKHRAKFLMPHIDLDEYVRMGDAHWHFPTALSSLIQRAEEPGNQTGSAKKRNSTDANTSRVHSLSFARYMFRHPPNPIAALQVTSSFRDKELEHKLSKYIVKPELVHALFNHWPTSWVPGTTGMAFPTSEIVCHHYRSTDANITTVHDESLSREALNLRKRLRHRYRSEWKDYSRLLLETNVSGSLPQSHSSLLQDESAEIILSDGDHSFVDLVNSVSAPTVIQPPECAADLENMSTTLTAEPL